MNAVIRVHGTRAEFDGDTWTTPDAKLKALLNGHRWMGSLHSEHGVYGSHVVALAEVLGAKVVSIDDTPTDVQDVE